jgi:iron complex transport system substrate-binding protein
VQQVGTIGSPKLEQIAALKPDLILSSKTRDADKYEQLSKIAPTVFAETVGKTWKENLLLDADALGKKPQAERVLADYRAKAEAVGKQTGDPSKLRVSTMRFISGGNEIRLYGKGSFIGSILADAGFNRPDSQQIDTTFAKISREQVSQADGDLLFYGAYSPAAKAKQDELVASQQWGQLHSVSNRKAFEVADDSWFLGLGPIAANLVLDDLQRHLAQK